LGHKEAFTFLFSELSERQKRNIYQFIESFKCKNTFETYEEMTKLYAGIVFDYGSSHFSLWKEKW